MLLLFLETQEPDRWRRIDGSGAIVSEGQGLAGLAPSPGEAVVAVAPPAHVSLHRVMLPALAPAQAAAAARAMAGELSAAPAETLHVALGAAQVNGGRWLAIADADDVAAWLARLEAAGLTPSRLVPAPLLLPDGSAAERDGLWLVRQGETAFAAEPALAAMMLDVLPPPVEPAAFAAGLSTRLVQAPNLRHGRFALVQPWRPVPGQWRRLALPAAAAVLALVLAEGAGWWRAARAADTAEAALAAQATELLPPGTLVNDPRAQVTARLRALGGSGGLAALAAPLLAAIEPRPGVSIASLEHAPGTGLVVILEGASPGEAAAIVATLRDAGLEAALGLPRQVGGVAQAELRVQAR
ncbi:type II secretion system protein GspL [Polymorphobacter sp.]|uniref:type II secretion system protein GspL n=1 Tax=Polymorphobacter sp. TaxID=1909290 RepID=UPI003F710523